MKHINDWHLKVNVHYFKPFNVKETGPIDKALSKFNKKIKEIGLMPEVQERMHFTSKSETRRKEKRFGVYRQRKNNKLEAH